jgi:HTH-type transcriptional regulator, sugar sensing transcriptional regulator
MSNAVIKTLTETGLSEKEARVYVALLELELATAFEISKQSGLNRSTTYVVLDSLKEKGLVGTSPDNPKVVQYFASNPDSLLHSVKSRAKKEQDVKENLEQILPELKALHKDTKHRPKVRVYEGKEGAKEVIYNILNERATDLKTCADVSKLFKFIPGFLEQNIKRVKKGVKMYAINPASKGAIEFGKTYKPLKNDEVALIPENRFRFPVHVGIYGNKVGFVSMQGEFGIVIENKEITESIRNIFDLAWEEAKRLNKSIKVN